MKTLKISIQKSGRLNEKSVEILKNCGLSFENYKSSLIATVANFPLEILFLRDDDIPEYVQDGIADLGIVGENVIIESGAEVSYLQPLGFGKCTLKIAIQSTSTITNLISTPYQTPPPMALINGSTKNSSNTKSTIAIK